MQVGWKIVKFVAYEEHKKETMYIKAMQTTRDL